MASCYKNLKEDTYLADVGDFLKGQRLRKHFSDVLHFPVFFVPLLKDKTINDKPALAFMNRKSSVGPRVSVWLRTNEVSFVHELIHLQQMLRGRPNNEITAKDAKQLLIAFWQEDQK